MSSNLIEYLFQALEEEIGLVITTSEPEALRQKCYRLQKKCPELKQLSFRESPFNPTGELWIVKKKGK